MAPRTLEPVAVSQLTIWGLRGLTALDPDLTRRAARRQAAPREPGPRARGADRRRPRATSTAGPAPPRTLPWPRRARPCRCVGPEHRASCRASSTSCSTTSIRIPATCRRATPARTASAGSARQAPDCVSSGAARPSWWSRPSPTDRARSPASGRRHDRRRSMANRRRARTPATVMRWIAGPEETQLTLAWRGRDGRLRSAELERAMVPPETVFAQRIGEALVIQVTAFNRSTDSHLAQAIEQGLAGPRPPEGIVLDLRGNRGGLLRQAVTAADTLLPAGIVAITVGRDPEATRVWRSNPGELAADDPRRRHGRRPHRQRRRDPGRGVGRPRPRRGDRQFDPRQGAGADHRPAAGRRRAVRDLEPRAGAARLADPGPRACCRRSAPAWDRTR